jgi:hypothetical protein
MSMSARATTVRLRRFEKGIGVLALVAYVGCIFGANWAIQRYGFVPAGFGLMAPAGAYFAGATFIARDYVQLALGRKVVLWAIAVGAALAAFLSVRLAVASGLSFYLSEMADYLVYTPLADRGRVVTAVLVSDTVGLALDSAVFLALAFGSLHFWPGQVLAKEWTTLGVLPVVWATRRYLVRRVLVVVG